VMDKDKTHRGYMWAFNTDERVAYVFSPSRSGETAAEVLGDSQGFLVADAFSGYNRVTTPKGRTRVGCWAHVRRRFFDARDHAPDECKQALGAILALYEVEYEAANENLLGSDKHLAMRKVVSQRIIAELRVWLELHKERFPPQSRMGKAVRYPLNHWESLIRFLEDASLPLDNNMSERLLRAIAVGRKNFLFVGHNGAGHNLAVLQSLVSSCQINGVDPQAYLTDVLIRIQTHPQSQIDELLPHRWEPP
jgi:transposase